MAARMTDRVDRPAALTLDLFGTLVFIDESRLPRGTVRGRDFPTTLPNLDGLLAELGLAIRADDFFPALREVSIALEAEKSRADIEIPSCERFRRALVALGVEAGAEEHAELLSARHMAGLASAVVCPSDRAGILDELGREYTIAVVSNFDHGPTARKILEEFGLLRHLDHAEISEEAGVRKPGSEIFHRALRRAGIDPTDAVHVGDSYEADVEGAVKAGLDAIWIDAGSKPHAPALDRIDDVRLLPRWLSERFAD